MIKKIGSLINLNVVSNFKRASFEVEPYNKDFLYFSARAVSAYETSGFNENGDAFLWDELLKSYKTFIGKNLFLDHDTSPLNTVGKVIDAYPVDEKDGEKYVECLCKVDKIAFPSLARNIETGVLNSVSMGASVDKSTCSVCGHYIESEISPRCEHMLKLKNEFVATWDFPKAFITKGRPIKAFFINEGVRFTELSIVTNPADFGALVKKVIASKINENVVVYEKKSSPVYSVWKIITPEKVVFSFPVYKIANLSKLNYYNSSKFGEYLKKTSISKIVQDLKIGGNFMDNIKSKIEKILEAEKEEEKMSEKEDIKILKGILKKLKDPEKNYLEIIEDLKEVLKNEEESADTEKGDVESLKEVLNEFKEYFEKTSSGEEVSMEEKGEESVEKGTEEEGKEEEGKEEEKEEEGELKGEDLDKLFKAEKEAHMESLLDLNENDLDVLNKVAAFGEGKEGKPLTDEERLAKHKGNEPSKEFKKEEPKKDEVKKEEPKKDEGESKEKKETFDIKYLKDSGIFPVDKFEVAGEIGEVSAGPLGKVKKVILKDSTGQVYELYVKLMKKGEKISLEEEITLEDKRNILGKLGDVSKLSDEEISSLFNSYIGFNNGNVEAFQSLITSIASMKENLSKIKIESDLKGKFYKCSYLLEKKMELGELIPDSEQINKLVIKGESFIKARDIVVEEMKSKELKRLMSLPTKEIEDMFSQYQKKSVANSSFNIEGFVKGSYKDFETDPDEEFLKKLPWQ